MIRTPATPAWVVLPGRQLEDAHVIAHRYHLDHGNIESAAVAATFAWVRGLKDGPITGRTEQPVTEQLARAEMWAAAEADSPGQTPPPVERFCADLGVAYWPNKDVPPVWATLAWYALRWMVGDGISKKPFLQLPLRREDGSAPVAEELYQAELTRIRGLYPEPERRKELRAKCEDEARRSRRLIAYIEETRENTGEVF